MSVTRSNLCYVQVISPWMDVRSVHSARVEERDSGGDTELCQDWESSDVGSSCLPALCSRSCGLLRIEVEDDLLKKCFTLQDRLILRKEQSLEPFESSGSILQLCDQVGEIGAGWSRCGSGSRGRAWSCGLIHGLWKSVDSTSRESSDEDLDDKGSHYLLICRCCSKIVRKRLGNEKQRKQGNNR